jgi:hypothetical protein
MTGARVAALENATLDAQHLGFNHGSGTTIRLFGVALLKMLLLL